MRYPGAQPSPKELMHMVYDAPQLGSQSSALYTDVQLDQFAHA